MFNTRKTKIGIQLQNECRAWEDFQLKFSRVHTLIDAKKLVKQLQVQKHETSGRKYYANLNFFLESFNVPSGSSYSERLNYIQFIQHLNESDTSKVGKVEEILKALQKSLDGHPLPTF